MPNIINNRATAFRYANYSAGAKSARPDARVHHGLWLEETRRPVPFHDSRRARRGRHPATTLSLIAWSEYADLESRLRGLSENELGSLDALVETAMRARVDDKEDVAIKVFNGWFDSRNKDYPGKLWSVWSPKVTAFMAQAYPDRAAKAAVDDVDEEVMRTGRPVARFVAGAYRYSMPIILGRTLAAPKEICESCHGAGMGLEDGEVIAVFSSSVSTAKDMAALREMLIKIAGGGALGGVLSSWASGWCSAGRHAAASGHDQSDAAPGGRRQHDRGSRPGSRRRDRPDGESGAGFSRRGAGERAARREAAEHRAQARARARTSGSGATRGDPTGARDRRQFDRRRR